MSNENLIFSEDQIVKLETRIDKSETSILTNLENATNALLSEIRKQNHIENNRKELEAFYNKKINDLNSEIDNLKNNLNESANENNFLFDKTETLKKESARQIELLKEQLDTANDKLNDYETKYKKLDNAFSKYQEISLPIKERLHNLVNGNSFLSFIVAGSNRDDIIGLWSFIQTRIKEEEYDDVSNLKIVFTFLLEVYCECNAEKQINLIEPTAGERFNSDSQIILGVETDGWIESVVLPGLFDSNDNKCIKKSIVKVNPY